MSRPRDEDEEHYPHLVAVLVDASQRDRVLTALRRRVRVVRPEEIDETARALAVRRRDVDVVAIEELEAEIRSLGGRRAANEAIRTDLLAEQARTREAADWCDAQPGRDRDERDQIAASSAVLEEQSRLVRESNRRLERVLEQRAAAEAALDEARAELAGLGAAGIDETGVRRQMEEASRRFHEVTAEYQALMTEVARRKAEVWDLEDKAAAQDSDSRPASDAVGQDQLRAMRAAVHAKFAAPEGGLTVVDPDRLAEAREDAAAAEAAADEAGARLTEAKTAVEHLERELIARTQESDSRVARHAAAVELEAQVAAVEQRLGEAEIASRAEVEDATRSMTRAELTLERLRHDARDRRRRLEAFAALAPESARPSADDDVVSHAVLIGRSLRTHADAMGPDLDHAAEAIERDRALAAGKQGEVDVLRERLDDSSDRPVDIDLTRAVEQLAADQLALAIDGGVSLDGRDGTLRAAWVLDADTTTPLIVLTDDPELIGWAIEQPANRAAVSSVTSLLELGVDDPVAN